MLHNETSLVAGVGLPVLGLLELLAHVVILEVLGVLPLVATGDEVPLALLPSVELVDFVGRAEDEAIDQHVRRGEAGDLVILGVALREQVRILSELPVDERDDVLHFSLLSGKEVGGHVDLVAKDDEELLAGRRRQGRSLLIWNFDLLAA